MDVPHVTPCPDCSYSPSLPTQDRRQFLGTSLGVAFASTGLTLFADPRVCAAPAPTSPSETAVKALFDSMSAEQKKTVCFAWDHQDPKRGLLRTRVANNWQITAPTIDSEFFTQQQRGIMHDIFRGLFQPEWVGKIEQQLKDDNGGQPWGTGQSIALFGQPGHDRFEFVMTGRHLTVRADGNSADHVALGGPIFHGHAAKGDNEEANHPGNVFWFQAVEANKVYHMLSGKQRKEALVAKTPREAQVPFRGPKGPFPGIPVRELASDQREQVQATLKALLAPYRLPDQEEVLTCLKKQGGLDACSLAFYQDSDIGDDQVWDNWRLEGPSFVWYFRGDPHVHIWINVADTPEPKLNAQG